MSKSKELINKEGNTILYNVEKCLGCGFCVDICKDIRKALELKYHLDNSEKTEIKHNTDLCSACGWCAMNCPFGALELKINGEKVVVDSWVPEAAIQREIKIQPEICLCCKQCEEVCPKGALKVYGKIQGTNECIGCGSCENSCPTGAISIIENKVEIDVEFCIRCGACEQSCPEDLIKIKCLDCLLCIGNTPLAEKKSNLRIEGGVNIDENKCIYCNLCQLNCPTQSIQVKKPFKGSISTKEDNCPNGCTVCIDICPCGVIEKRENKILINKDACIFCGSCYRVCPSKIIDFEREDTAMVDSRGDLLWYIKYT